jgi:hypothetical protein
VDLVDDQELKILGVTPLDELRERVASGPGNGLIEGLPAGPGLLPEGDRVENLEDRLELADPLALARRLTLGRAFFEPLEDGENPGLRSEDRRGCRSFGRRKGDRPEQVF